MFYKPVQLEGYLLRCLHRLNEEDCKAAITILSKRLEDLQKEDYYLEISVEDLLISHRAKNLLISAGLETVGSIIRFGYDKFRFIRGMGQTTTNEIKTVIDILIERKEQVRAVAGQDLCDFLLDALRAKNKNTGTDPV